MKTIDRLGVLIRQRRLKIFSIHIDVTQRLQNSMKITKLR